MYEKFSMNETHCCHDTQDTISSTPLDHRLSFISWRPLSISFHQVLEVFHDPFGKKCQEMFEDKTMDRKAQPVASSTLKPLPLVPEDGRLSKTEVLSKRLEDTKLVDKVCVLYKILLYRTVVDNCLCSTFLFISE